MQSLSRLRARDLECVRGSRMLFRDLNCEVASGGALHVRGENGAGKTSLLRILCGLHQPECGEVFWNDAPINRSRFDFHCALSFISHRPAMKAELSPRENLAALLALSARAASAHEINNALQRFALQDCKNLQCAHLSAGQLQRVALAGLMLRRGGVWVLDEPAAALDHAGVNLLEEILAEQIAHGGIVIFSSHQEINFGAARQILNLNDFRQK